MTPSDFTRHLCVAWNIRAGAKSLFRGKPGRGAARLAPLDGCRALAVLWVLSFHLIFITCLRKVNPLAELAAFVQDAPTEPSVPQQWLTSWATQPTANGDMGVDLFFVLSGYLIAHLHLKELARFRRVNVLRFYCRRVLRIWPALALALGVTAAFTAATGNVSTLAACRANAWNILTFLQNWFPSDCLAQGWSVATEVQLYLVSPLLMWGAVSPATLAPRRLGLPFLAAVALSGVLINLAVLLIQGDAGFETYGMWPPPWTYMSPFTRLMPYVAGMAASIAMFQLQGRGRNRAQQLPLAGSAGAGKAAASDCQQEQQEEQELAQLHCGCGGRTASLPTVVPAASNGTAAVQPQSRKSAATDVSIVIAPHVVACSTDTSVQSGTQHGVVRDPAACGGCVAWLAAATRAHAPRLLLTCTDLLCLAVALALSWTGVGNNAYVMHLTPGFTSFLRVAGRCMFGCAVAWGLCAVMLGRMRPVGWLLSRPMFAPVAALSYSLYLLQGLPLSLIPSWAAVGVATMYAAWGVTLLSMAIAVVACLGCALPSYLLVERPLSLLWPRSW